MFPSNIWEFPPLIFSCWCVISQGDSGGPLACYLPDVTRYYLVGISSFGFGCGRPRLPGVYLQTGFYKRWIQSQVILFDKAMATKTPYLFFLTAGWIVFCNVLWKKNPIGLGCLSFPTCVCGVAILLLTANYAIKILPIQCNLLCLNFSVDTLSLTTVALKEITFSWFLFSNT